jgi:hypothetical protein
MHVNRHRGRAVIVLFILGLLSVFAGTSRSVNATILYGDDRMNCGTPIYANNGVYKLDCTQVGSTYTIYWTGVTYAGNYWYATSDGSWPGGAGYHQNQWGTVGSDCIAYMQTDGNFVLYNHDLTSSAWSTSTYNHNGSFLDLQDDGNLVVYTSGSSAIWSLY